MDGTDADIVYYGVSVPGDQRENYTEDDLIFTEKQELLKFLKTAKGSRFKTFKTRESALEYIRTPFENQVTEIVETSKSDVKKAVYEEKSQFKGPKPQDMTILRRHIEKGEIDSVRDIIWNNPRYLISSGDTPTILQEAFRYNALHICAKSNQPEICKLIIETLEDEEFLKLMYPDDTPETRSQRQEFLLDLYLNMPDKGPLETPLHFACKFGFPEVVQILSLHPMIEKNYKNKFGEKPCEIIGQRCRTASDKSRLKENINSALDSTHFVPLYRSYDETTPAVVGKVWIPTAGAPSSPVGGSNPKDPELLVRAYAGPMSPNVASKFQNKWSRCPAGSPQSVRQRYYETRRTDCDKGLERLGRQLADEMNVAWKEYWTFLKDFVDLKSEDGLQKLEDYLRSVAMSMDATSNQTPIVSHSSNNNNTKCDFTPPRTYRQNNDLNLSDSFDEGSSFSPEIRSPSCYTCVNKTADSSLDSLIDKMDHLHLSDADNDDKCDDVWKDACETTDEMDSDEDEDDDDEFYDSLCEFSDRNMDIMSPPPLTGSLLNNCNFPVACSTPEKQLKSPTPAETLLFKKLKIFIEGNTPTKLDLDVLRAIGSCDIPSDKYPYINLWKRSISSYSERDMKSWPSPANLRRCKSNIKVITSRSEMDNIEDTSLKKNLMESFLSDQ